MAKNNNKQDKKPGKDEVKQREDEIPFQDSIYVYDDKKIDQQNKDKPWKNDPKYFQNVRINVLAATKMVRHAVQGVHEGRKKGGLPTEGEGQKKKEKRRDKDKKNFNITTILFFSVVLLYTLQLQREVMDCVELPVEGSETRVVADDEKVLGFMTRMQDRIESVNKLMIMFFLIFFG
ncbi:hypothetical protein RFI_24721 [Reticulomyxa filosa]|uniref:Uncharacterized protein n=1 Tax=Reticulomyxa filosa TaxID=46433 RepID=X6MFG5_RETFI|nr:hypothetical protein RFI_24721 [Reticulomyxa filosa]|eukprot:ETO12649.1 hypothetical protein RFI_24721 [Reticulomyxa filosa]